MCVDNTETLQQAKSLSRELDEDIECRIKRYSKCLSQCSKITVAGWWLQIKMTLMIGKKYRERIMNEPDDE
jgi:uncharacterized protein YfeS